MQDWIGGLLAVRGALLVLAGGVITTVKTLAAPWSGNTNRGTERCWFPGEPCPSATRS